MPIICQCCGKKIEKYCVVKYEIDYLEKYLSDYFERPIKDITMRSNYDTKFIKFKSICFRILVDFSKFDKYEIASYYAVSATVVTHALMNLKPKSEDYLFIAKDLANDLPEIIREPNGHIIP
jgi:hypothetical protein